MQTLSNAIILWLISRIGFCLWSRQHQVLCSHTYSPVYFPRCLVFFFFFFFWWLPGSPSFLVLKFCPTLVLHTAQCIVPAADRCHQGWPPAWASVYSLPPQLASVYMSVPSSGLPVTSCWTPPTNPTGCLGDHPLPSTIFYQPDGLPVLGHCGSISDLPHLEQYVLSPRLPEPRFHIHLCQGRKFLDE